MLLVLQNRFLISLFYLSKWYWGAPLPYTTFVVALYMMVSESFTNFASIIEICPVFTSSMVIRLEVSLLYRNPKHTFINQLRQAYFDERVLPIMVCITG